MSLVTPRKGYKSVPWLFGKEIEIPQEWEVKRLDEIGEIIGGGTPDSTNKDYWNGNILWAVPTDITKLQVNQIEDTERKITKLGLENSSAKLLPNKTILITSRATIGECAITTKPITTNQGFQNIICYNNYHNYLIFYLIKQFPNNLLRLSQGTTFLEINKNQMKKIIIPISNNIKEQQKIATILSNVDNLIESTGKVITHSKKVKTGLMQKLLTRGIGHTKFKKVPWLFGKEIEIPEEWEIVIIKKLVTFHKQGLYTTQPYSKNGIKIARVNDLENPNLSYDKMNNLELDPKTFDSFKISKGDFLIARTGNIGNYGIVTEDIECVHISDIIRFNFNLNELLNEYFGLFFESHLLLVQLLMIQQSSSHIHINAETMKSLKIPLPPLSEQQKISSILSNIDSKITSQEQYKEKLEKLKKSLMQKLLTGEVRV